MLTRYPDLDTGAPNIDVEIFTLTVSYLVRRNTFSQEIKVTNWYHPLPSHQKVPEAAFPTRQESKSEETCFISCS